jgi:two-component system OmpR family response regulator
MNENSDRDDEEFAAIFEGRPSVESQPKAPPSLTAVSEAQRKEVEEETVKLRQSGYCINIVRPAAKAAPLAPGAKRYILCIDDDVPLVQILARKLTLDGYTVRTASDLKTIVAELQKLPFPDLILLDVGLPGVSGFDLLQKVRKHPKFGSVPVIMLTGRVSPEDVLRGMTSGADGYVSKPFQFDALAIAIKTVLGMQ